MSYFVGTQSLLLRIRRAKGKKNWNKMISVVGDIKTYGTLNVLWHLDEYLWDMFQLELSQCHKWRVDERVRFKLLFNLSSDQILKRIQLYAYNAGYYSLSSNLDVFLYL